MIFFKGIQSVFDIFFLLWFYSIARKKPLSPGYSRYRDRLITQVINENIDLADEKFKHLSGNVDERIVEIPWIYNRLKDSEGKLLDAGSVLNNGLFIGLPKIEKKKLYIATLSPEKRSFWSKGISYLYIDLRELCFCEAYFDEIVCISTLEHIGLDNTLLYCQDHRFKENNGDSFIRVIINFSKMLKNGGKLFITVPYGAKHVAKWYQVFNEDDIDQIVYHFNPEHLSIEYFLYSNGRWQSATKDDCKYAKYYDRLDDSQEINKYCVAAEAIVCIELQK